MECKLCKRQHAACLITRVSCRMDTQCSSPFSCRWFAIMEIQLFVVLFLYKYQFVLLDAVPKEVKDLCLFLAFHIFKSFIHWAQLNDRSQLSLCVMKQNALRGI